MADQAEVAFVKNFINTLGSQPVTFENDFQQSPENTLRKVPILQVPVPQPPERKVGESSSSSSAETIQIVFKSLKPPFSVTLPISPTDPVSSIKSLLSSQPRAPPADAQRLLLKGKALADSKLVKEYPIKSGDTINLMVKPGFEWDPTKEPAPAAPTTPPPATTTNDDRSLSPNPQGSGVGEGGPGGKRKGHGRIPSVILSPSPSSSGVGLPDVTLVHDDGGKGIHGEVHMDIDRPPSAGLPQTTYRNTVSQPEFWEKLHGFFSEEFSNRSDVSTAFEEFLNASKGQLTASEIAMIRDRVGVLGMAGT